MFGNISLSTSYFEHSIWNILLIADVSLLTPDRIYAYFSDRHRGKELPSLGTFEAILAKFIKQYPAKKPVPSNKVGSTSNYAKKTLNSEEIYRTPLKKRPIKTPSEDAVNLSLRCENEKDDSCKNVCSANIFSLKKKDKDEAILLITPSDDNKPVNSTLQTNGHEPNLGNEPKPKKRRKDQTSLNENPIDGRNLVENLSSKKKIATKPSEKNDLGQPNPKKTNLSKNVQSKNATKPPLKSNNGGQPNAKKLNQNNKRKTRIPKTKPEEKATKNPKGQSSRRPKRVNQLIGMGYSEKDAIIAVKETTTLEDAVEYLFATEKSKSASKVTGDDFTVATNASEDDDTTSEHVEGVSKNDCIINTHDSTSSGKESADKRIKMKFKYEKGEGLWYNVKDDK